MRTVNLPEDFIKNLNTAIPLYSSLYIYCLAASANGKLTISKKDLAAEFNVLETDILNALIYWSEKKLLTFVLEEDLKIIFKESKNEESKKFMLLSKPVYTPKELELYRSYEEIENMFYLGEKAMGRLLSANELSTIYSFYDWLRLPVEVIEILLKYCANAGQRDMRYIEQVALNWSEAGTDTAEKAEELVKNRSDHYKEVMKALGRKNREAAPAEIRYIDKWLTELEYPMEIILEACDKTILNVGEPNFKYTDTILNSWYEKKVKTLDDILQLEADYKNEKQKNIYKKSKTNVKSPAFANYKQREVDYGKLEALNLKLLKEG